MRKKAFLGLFILLWVSATVWAQDTINLIPYENETFGYTSLAPEGWNEVAPGALARQSAMTDITTLVQQSAPAISADDLLTALLPNLLLEEAPEPIGEATHNNLTWSRYYVDVIAPGGIEIAVDLAIAEDDSAAYVILMQTTPDDYDSLHEAVFVPVLEAFSTGAEDNADSPDDSTYSDPDGLFTVPIPTNWTAETIATDDGMNYARLVAPEDSVLAYFTAQPIAPDFDEDFGALLETAWQRVAPDFALTYREQDVFDSSDPAITGDYERVHVITYDTSADENGRITQGIVFTLEGYHYFFLIDTTLEAAQQRGAQINILNTGFTVTAIEEESLSAEDILPVDETIIANLEAYVADALETYDTPGLQVAIVQDGEVVYSNAFGTADLTTGEPLTTDALMMVGSITKTFTTTFMAQLADAGVLNFDEPAITYMPQFQFGEAELTDSITVANLVCACTGVPRRDLEFIFNTNELTATDIVESLAGFELYTDIGEAFQYSNQMVATGGYVAAMAGGASYETLDADFSAQLRANLLDPLGMSRTKLFIDEVIADANYATSHSLDIYGDVIALPIDVERTIEIIAPSGAIWSNVEEMTAYLQMLMANGIATDGTRLVSEQGLTRLWQPQIDITADAQYGLGWFLADYNGLREISHGGTTIGFQAEMAFLPEADFGVVILSNRTGSPVPALVKATLYEQVFGQEAEADASVRASLAIQDETVAEQRTNFIATTANLLDTVTGTYRNNDLGTMVVTLADDSTLQADFGEFVTRLQAYDDPDQPEATVFIMADAPLAGLTFNVEDGVWVLNYGAEEYSFVAE
jgi:CubicO group peptidase (beta-lactamase class C family)